MEIKPKTFAFNMLMIAAIVGVGAFYAGVFVGMNSLDKMQVEAYEKGMEEGVKACGMYGHGKPFTITFKDNVKYDETTKELFKKKKAELEKNSTKWETVEMNVSAYCPCEKCCDHWGKIPVSSGKRKTASGHTIKVGDKFVAAPRTYPFGTEMIIEGYAGGKIVKVEDVGGAIKGNKLDLYFDSHQAALDWGRKTVIVRVKK